MGASDLNGCERGSLLSNDPTPDIRGEILSASANWHAGTLRLAALRAWTNLRCKQDVPTWESVLAAVRDSTHSSATWVQPRRDTGDAQAERSHTLLEEAIALAVPSSDEEDGL